MRTLNRFAPGFKRIMVAVLAIAMLVSSVSFSKGTNAKAAASTIGSAEDYSVTATDVSDSLCRITFTPTNPAAYVIIHYKVNDGEQVRVHVSNTISTMLKKVIKSIAHLHITKVDFSMIHQ